MSSRFEASLSSMSDLSVLFFLGRGGGGGGLLVFCLFVKLLDGLWDPLRGIEPGPQQ